MKAKFLILIIGVMGTVGVGAQSLVEVLEQTLATNPNIQSTAYNVTAAEALRRQAASGYLPSVDLFLARGLERSDNTTTRAAEEIADH